MRRFHRGPIPLTAMSHSAQGNSVRNRKTLSSDLVNLLKTLLFLQWSWDHTMWSTIPVFYKLDISRESGKVILMHLRRWVYWYLMPVLQKYAFGMSDWTTLSFLTFLFVWHNQHCSCLNLLFLLMFHPVLFSLISRLWAALPVSLEWSTMPGIP